MELEILVTHMMRLMVIQHSVQTEIALQRLKLEEILVARRPIS